MWKLVTQTLLVWLVKIKKQKPEEANYMESVFLGPTWDARVKAPFEQQERPHPWQWQPQICGFSLNPNASVHHTSHKAGSSSQENRLDREACHRNHLFSSSEFLGLSVRWQLKLHQANVSPVIWAAWAAFLWSTTGATEFNLYNNICNLEVTEMTSQRMGERIHPLLEMILCGDGMYGRRKTSASTVLHRHHPFNWHRLVQLVKQPARTAAVLC